MTAQREEGASTTDNTTTLSETADTSVDPRDLDPAEFINKTYKEASLSELNDSLVVLAKSISKARNQHKELISRHFSKFVQCRSVIEDVWTDIRKKGLDKPLTDNIERNLSILSSKFHSIISSISSDIKEQNYDTRRLSYRNRLASIFNLKEELRANQNAYENFARAYERALAEFEPVKNSKFLASKLDESQPEVRQFLESIYDIIADEKISFEDACYHFDLYFRVSREKRDGKLENTLLLNYKENTLNRLASSQEYLEYLSSALGRLLKRIPSEDEVRIREGIGHFFECLDRLTVTPLFSKLLFRQTAELADSLELPGDCKRDFQSRLSSLRINVFSRLIDEKSIPSIVELYRDFSELLSDEDTEDIQDVILERVSGMIQSKKDDKYEYLRYEDTDIRLVRGCFGQPSSRRNKKLTAAVRKYQSGMIEEIADELAELIARGDDVRSLMEAIRLMERVPGHYRNVIFQAKSAIMKRPVVYYYLARMIRMERPMLSKAEQQAADEINRQFSFLLN